MDPEHRHELKESDLERFARNFGPWWQKHGTRVLLVIALLLLSFVVVRYLSTRAERIRENAYTALAEASNPGAKHEVAVEYQNVPGLPARAWLEAGDMKLQEALVGPPGAQQQGLRGGQQSLSPEERTERLERAAEFYKRVIDKSDQPLLVINARLGLAAAHESLDRFEKARTQYEKIREEAEGRYPELAERASARLADLDRIQEPIEFPEPPEPAQDGSGGPLQGGSLPSNLLDLRGGGGQSGGGPGGQPAPGAGEQGGDSLLDLPSPPEQPMEDGGASSEAPSGDGGGSSQRGESSQDGSPQQQEQNQQEQQESSESQQ
jgi:hypothetical protein